MTRSSTRPIRRVVVPFDAVSENRTAIETAAQLAARAGAPLHGIFVEDEDLLHLAGLPFSRQVTLGAGVEELTTEQVELQLRAAAERSRKELAAAARRHRVRHSFEIVRGAAERVLAAATASDLVVAGTLTRPVAGQFRIERRWWSSVKAAAGPFLLARHDWRSSGEVVLLLRDLGEAAARLVEAAAQIAAAAEGGLTVICPPSVAGSEGFEAWLAERIAGHPVRLQVEVTPAEPSAVHERIGELDCRLLAIDAAGVEGDGDRLRKLVEGLACDILIVR